MNQWRYQQQYWNRVRQDQQRLQNWQYNNYNDSGQYYRYNRGGSYYETNQYGAQQLQQAINYGYEEGLRAGQADRQDRWNGGFQDSYAYQDGIYGYDGYYVDVNEYQYYFRQGFERGYQDGYYGRYQYGQYSNGRYSILGAILSQILNLQAY